MKNDLAIIILAAGKGTRMKSAKPKVLHEVGGLPLISHVIQTAEKLKPQKIVVVVGPGMGEIAKIVKPYATVVQKSAKGTGDAVKTGMTALKNFKSGDVLVLYGDVPLVRVEDLKNLLKARKQKKAGICIASMVPHSPEAYGRMVLNKDGSLKKIVEFRDATKEEKAIVLCNTGILCADAAKLPGWLGKIKNNNAKKEFYLTDLPEIAAKEKIKTYTLEVPDETVCGVNTRMDLAMVEYIFQHEKRLGALEGGVTMQDPETVYFSWDTNISADVTIEPNVVLGPGVSVGAGSIIRSFSHIAGTVIGRNASIGPFARLRPGTVLGDKVRIGNFVEVKKSKIGKGSKINHLAYVGDTIMGKETNFSAGAITVNFDGFHKYQTTIGKNVMVGSNVNLIAPVTINDGAFIAAGSTVTEDVPAHSLSIGRERAKIQKNWAAEFRKGRVKEKK
jgi:bifunctional UDP-N-acetylglucosamine pyrophosphorylase/glucosamine-1-phosphate N-acetyltransferase